MKRKILGWMWFAIVASFLWATWSTDPGIQVQGIIAILIAIEVAIGMIVFAENLFSKTLDRSGLVFEKGKRDFFLCQTIDVRQIGHLLLIVLSGGGIMAPLTAVTLMALLSIGALTMIVFIIVNLDDKIEKGKRIRK